MMFVVDVSIIVVDMSGIDISSFDSSLVSSTFCFGIDFTCIAGLNGGILGLYGPAPGRNGYGGPRCIGTCGFLGVIYNGRSSYVSSGCFISTFSSTYSLLGVG